MENGEDPAGGGEAFVAVVNDEGQYSVWWEDRELPAGWRPTEHRGTREECLARISEVWTDMRPLSLRAGGPGAPRG